MWSLYTYPEIPCIETTPVKLTALFFGLVLVGSETCKLYLGAPDCLLRVIAKIVSPCSSSLDESLVILKCRVQDSLCGKSLSNSIDVCYEGDGGK